MVTDPPYLVDYDGGNHPQTWSTDEGLRRGQDPALGRLHAITTARVAFYDDFFAVALDRGPVRAACRLPVLRHDACRDRAGGLARQRAAAPIRS